MDSNDCDLPEPKPHPKLSESEYRERRWSLYRALFIFTACYGTLHKVFIPLMLSKTNVLIASYAQVDFWFLPSIVLSIYLLLNRRLKSWGSLMAGTLVTYSAWELRAIFSGQHEGWLAWSHALSSLPQGVMALILLTSPVGGRKIYISWAGAVGCLSLLLSIHLFTPTPSEISKISASQQIGIPSDESSIPLATSTSCGENAFRIDGEQIPKNNLSLEIKSCGLHPLALRVENQSPLRLKLEITGALNLRVHFYDQTGHRKRQSNRVLRSQDSEIHFVELEFHKGEVAAVIFSDINPKVGQALIVSEQFSNLNKTRFIVHKNHLLEWRISK